MSILAIGIFYSMLPLFVRREAGTPVADDVEVYRDQLAELERDVDAGVVPAGEAAASRDEIQRRLLIAARQMDDRPTEDAEGKRPALVLALVSLVAVIAISATGYAILGSPPRSVDRLAEAIGEPGENGERDLLRMMANAEAYLAENPEDGRGWDVLAPLYLSRGDAPKAVEAYRKAITYLEPSATRLAGLGEALSLVAQGRISDEALAAFERSLELEPDNPRAQYYRAVAFGQRGAIDRARKAWTDLIENSPPDAFWLPSARAELAALDGNAAVGEQAAGGPAEPDAESGVTADAQNEMIENMVRSLDERLREDPDDLEGWKRLIRSYVVLNRRPAAADALARALVTFPRSGEDGKMLIAFATSQGIEPGDVQ